MSRALAAQVNEFMNLFTKPSPILSTLSYTVSTNITRWPYEHKRLGRMYSYTVKDGFELISKLPYDCDLMGFSDARAEFTRVLKEKAGLDTEGLDNFKQVVLHYETYTGAVTLEKANGDKVLELEVKRMK